MASFGGVRDAWIIRAAVSAAFTLTSQAGNLQSSMKSINQSPLHAIKRGRLIIKMKWAYVCGGKVLSSIGQYCLCRAAFRADM